MRKSLVVVVADVVVVVVVVVVMIIISSFLSLLAPRCTVSPLHTCTSLDLLLLI